MCMFIDLSSNSSSSESSPGFIVSCVYTDDSLVWCMLRKCLWPTRLNGCRMNRLEGQSAIFSVNL